MKGKSIGTVGSVVSVVFSFVGIMIALFYKSIMKTPEFIDTFRESFLQNGGKESEVESTLEVFKNLLNIFNVGSIIYLILGIIALVLILTVKQSNKKLVGVYFIVLSVLHLFGIRILCFVLLLISGLQIQKEEPVQEQMQFNE